MSETACFVAFFAKDPQGYPLRFSRNLVRRGRSWSVVELCGAGCKSAAFDRADGRFGTLCKSAGRSDGSLRASVEYVNDPSFADAVAGLGMDDGPRYSTFTEEM